MTGTIFITLTEQCNRRCSFCFNLQGVGELRDLFLDPDRLIQTVAGEPEANTFILTGGEPMLHPRLNEIITSLGRRGSVTMISNTDLITTRTIDSLTGLDQVIVSIKSARPRELEHLALRLNLLADRGFPLSSIFVITRQNIDEVPHILVFAENMTLPLLLQPAYINQEHPDYDQLSLWNMSPNQWQKLDEIMLRSFNLGGSPSYYRFWKSFYTGKPLVPQDCFMGKFCHVIQATGDLKPCFHRQADLAAFPACFGEHCLSLFTGI